MCKRLQNTVFIVGFIQMCRLKLKRKKRFVFLSGRIEVAWHDM